MSFSAIFLLTSCLYSGCEVFCFFVFVVVLVWLGFFLIIIFSALACGWILLPLSFIKAAFGYVPELSLLIYILGQSR